MFQKTLQQNFASDVFSCKKQKNAILQILHPTSRGFKNIKPGSAYNSSKVKRKILESNCIYITLLTQQFLIQDKHLYSNNDSREPSSAAASFNIPEDVLSECWNVAFLNSEEKGLKSVSRLLIKDVEVEREGQHMLKLVRCKHNK